MIRTPMAVNQLKVSLPFLAALSGLRVKVMDSLHTFMTVTLKISDDRRERASESKTAATDFATRRTVFPYGPRARTSDKRCDETNHLIRSDSMRVVKYHVQVIVKTTPLSGSARLTI